MSKQNRKTQHIGIPLAAGVAKLDEAPADEEEDLVPLMLIVGVEVDGVADAVDAGAVPDDGGVVRYVPDSDGGGIPVVAIGEVA